MTDVTPHLGLPLIAAGQAQKHVTHNDALAQLDALVQLACLDKDLAAPPANPGEGDRYLIAAAAPTGAWTGLAGQVVRYTDGVWVGTVPAVGWRAYLVDEKALYAFDGQAWASVSAGASDRLGVNATADATNRLTVKSDAALFNWDDVTPGSGDMRITLNKKASQRDAGFVFQAGYASRALFGLLGGDDVTLKTSSDGSTFVTALSAASATGVVTFTTNPRAPTPGAADNSTRLATTAYVDRAVSATSPQGGGRTAVSDANATLSGTDRTVAITALTAPRTLTLPSASAFPQGTSLAVVDESGACSAVRTITVARSGTDTINGLVSATLATAYGSLALQSNGRDRWTVTNRTPIQNRATFAAVTALNSNQAIAASFDRIKFTRSENDIGGNWDATNNWYIVPRAGIYQITGSIRVADGSSAGSQYGISVHTAEEDNPAFLWTAVGPTPSTRSSYAYARMVAMTGGERLRMVSYADSKMSIIAAVLQICLIAEAA